MEHDLAAKCLTNVMQLVRSPGILVCAGLNLELKNLIADAGFVPSTEFIHEIHEGWSSHRLHYQENRGKHYFELEDLDETRADWQIRYSTIFIKR